MPNVSYRWDKSLLYQTGDALSKTSGQIYFPTTPRFSASVTYLRRFSWIFHDNISTKKIWFEMDFIEDLILRSWRKTHIMCAFMKGAWSQVRGRFNNLLIWIKSHEINKIFRIGWFYICYIQLVNIYTISTG